MKMKDTKIGYVCYTCHKRVRKEHFTAEDGRILCYDCRKKEKAKPACTKSFVSALGMSQKK